MEHSNPSVRKRQGPLNGRFKGIKEDQAEAEALLVVPSTGQIELTLGFAKQSEGLNQDLYSARTR